jgi:hypothetical protein
VLLYLAGRNLRTATGAGYSGQFARPAGAGPLSALSFKFKKNWRCFTPAIVTAEVA